MTTGGPCAFCGKGNGGDHILWSGQVPARGYRGSHYTKTVGIGRCPRWSDRHPLLVWLRTMENWLIPVFYGIHILGALAYAVWVLVGWTKG